MSELRRNKHVGAQFEITIDGTPRTHRDFREHAIEAGQLLKGENPHSAVAVRDVRTDERTVVTANRRKNTHPGQRGGERRLNRYF
jgi:hypothetical protein